MIQDRLTVLPGAVLGVVGGGQLGRMFAQAAQRMGYRVHVLTDDLQGPAQVADRVVEGSWQDEEKLCGFAAGVDALSFESENVSAEALESAAAFTRIRPSPDVLRITQNRNREKSTLARAGFPVTPFIPVHHRGDFKQALSELGTPSVLKTATNGYDGKGQVRLATPKDANAAYQRLDDREQILEQWMQFDCEISVVAARNDFGQVACYEPFENEHRNHILDLTRYPARVDPTVAREAVTIACDLVEQLKVVGVLCVEFFLVSGTKLYINELAPRPHNSGHLTLDAAVTSQFEQHVRAVCGLPLGAARLDRPAAMANLLGDLWQTQAPNWQTAFTYPDVVLHLYGKRDAKPGRKMGHLTALAEDVDQAVDKVLKARRSLRQCVPQRQQVGLV